MRQQAFTIYLLSIRITTLWWWCWCDE